MGAKVNALKELYTALGGDAADAASIDSTAEMISAIADYVGGGGAAELPTVTADDNGKVLTVVDGEWTAASK